MSADEEELAKQKFRDLIRKYLSSDVALRNLKREKFRNDYEKEFDLRRTKKGFREVMSSLVHPRI